MELNKILQQIKNAIAVWHENRRKAEYLSWQKRVHEEFRIEERDGTICITHCGRPIDTFCDNDCVDDLLSSIGKYRTTAVTYKHRHGADI